MTANWNSRVKIVALALALAAVEALPAAAADTHWVRSWGASPQAAMPAMGPFPATPSFADQTIRQVVRVSGGGGQVRIRLSNEFGPAAVTIGGAHIALAGPDGTIQPGSDHALSFGGKPSAVIRAGAPLLSDPVDMDVAPLSRLAVSVYVQGKLDACTCHGTAVETAYVAAGDATGAQAMAGAAPLQVRPLLSAVEVAAASPAATIVTFGDSITDGVGATPGKDRRWPDQFADRLQAEGAKAAYVSNEGISGNRVLNDGMGVSALQRFDRDVLATPGLGYVIVFEGINDIGISFMPKVDGPFAAFMKSFAGDPISADDIIAGYKQLIARAHARGVKIYGATITPFEGAATYTPQGEAARQQVNAWIRTSGAFDAVLDFDAVWRDPARPSQIKDGYHMGDHLHGSDAGYKALADSIDLKLFK